MNILKYYNDYGGSISCLIDGPPDKKNDDEVIFTQTDYGKKADPDIFKFINELSKQFEKLIYQNKCTIELEGLTESEPCLVQVHYEKTEINGVDKIAFRYFSHKSEKLYVPYYEPLLYPLYYNLEDPFTGEIVADIHIDDIHVDDIYMTDVELNIDLTPNDTIFLDVKEFEKRKSVSKLIKLSESFREIIDDKKIDREDFEQLFEEISQSNKSVFITGKAGTGKSTFLRYLVQKSENSPVVVAPTGVSAINVRGQTIHSFFKFPHHALDSANFPIQYNSRYKEINTLIIDEISMVRADVFDTIDIVLKKNKESNLPFGGARVIMFGDLFQLAPILSNDPDLNQFFNDRYRSEWFFHSDVFDPNNITTKNLLKVYRQTEKDFVNLLNRIRIGENDSDVLEMINQRFITNIPMDGNPITLTARNAKAIEINKVALDKISSKSFQYTGEFVGEFYRSTLPADYELILKEGAQVMFIKNDPNRRWVNGTIGIVQNLGKNNIKVQIGSNIYTTGKVTWECFKYKYDPKEKILKPKIVGTYTQYPLKLAWALTIHKSQGKTFDKVIVDLGIGAFAPGQFYVAVSRCTTFDGLFLKQRVRASDIIVDRRIRDYFRTIGIDIHK